MTGRALVLGGGGITGVGWELGLLAGLAERGIDLAGADLLVGTSAGAIVGAQITSGIPLPELYAAQLAADGEVTARMSALLKLRYALALARSKDPVQLRVRLGRLAAPALSEDRRRAVIGSQLPRHEWPAQRMLITAVDADTGELAAFGAASGVSLIDAVSASCAVPGVWPPVVIAGRRWMDGGMRSATNADLAAECDRVVTIAPVAQGFRATMPAATRQVADLARAGRAVALVTPDRAALAAIGRNLLDGAFRAPAARAGYAQAASVVSEVAAVWEGVGGAPFPGSS